MRKEFTNHQQQTTYHQQQQPVYHHQQLLATTTATSPMKPKKRGSDSSKKPKKRRSSSASDKENDAAQQQHQHQQLQQSNSTAESSNVAVMTTTNGYTNSNNTPEAASLTAPTTDSNNSQQTTQLPSNNSNSTQQPTPASTAATPSQTSSPTAVQTKVYDPHAMDFELEAALELMTRFVSKTPSGKANHHKLGQFNALLVKSLREYYLGHWYPERPMRGSGHRCLRVNQSGSTSIIEKTAITSDNRWVLDSLPKEFTLWIDPGEVSYRIGEDGSICVHFNHPIKRPVSTKQG